MNHFYGCARTHIFYLNYVKLKHQSPIFDIFTVTPTHEISCIILSVYYLVSLSPPKLRGHRCREESLLPVSRPFRPEQPAGPSV